jgi:uncharacterized repeat protein (TIGR01451 family)
MPSKRRWVQQRSDNNLQFPVNAGDGDDAHRRPHGDQYMNLYRRLLEGRRTTRSMLPLVAAALLLVSLPLVGGLRPAGAAGGADIALFFDPAYVDTADGGGEASNMLATLTAQGNTVTTFTGTSGAAWSAALADKDLVVVPELEKGNLNTGLTSDAKTALRDFVQGGGGFLSNMDSGARIAGLLNTVYGYSLAFAAASNATATLNTAAATGTAYEGGPATIPRLSAVRAVVASTLPSNAKQIYTSDSGTRVWVTYFTEGTGQIALLGWDWFNAAPTGTGDGGWLSVLSRSIDQITNAGLEATVAASSVVAGSTGSATVSVTNNRGADATSVELTGSVPATLAVTGVSSSQGTCTVTQAYTCSVGTLASGQTVTATVTFSVAASTAATSVNHSVHVTSAEGPRADAQGTATITESNTLAVAAGAASVAAGASGQFTVGVTNNGPSNADTATVTGTVPAVASVTGVSSTQGTCSGTQSYTCAVGTLAPEEQATITVSFAVAPSGTAQTVQHNAQATSAEGASQSGQGNLTITESNALSLSAGAGSAPAGGSDTVSVVVTNDGPSNADTITVTGTVPAAAPVTSVSSSQGTCSGTQSYSCAVGTLAPGASATVTVAFSVAGSTTAQTVQHSAHASSVEGAAADASASIVISEENALTAASGGASVVAGRTGTFTVEVTNHGPSNADTTTVTGTVPSAATVTGVSSTQGTCTGTQSYSCVVGTLAPEAAATITVGFSVAASIPAQTLHPSVHVASAEGGADDDQGTVTVTEDNDVRLSSTGVSPAAGEAGQFTVVVTNDGPSNGDTTTLTGTVPAGAAVTSVTSTQGTCSGTQSFTCAVGTLAPDASATITVAFSTDPSTSAQTLTPTFHATSAEGGVANGQGTVAIREENTLSVAAGDDSLPAGESGSFTVDVTNHGPSDADVTTLAGTVPATGHVTGVSPSAGTCTAAQSYTCALGTLAPAETATVTVHFSVDPSAPAQTLTHTAHAASAEGAGTDADGSVSITEHNALTVVAGNASATAGRSATFTVAVTNDGPSDADGTVVTGTVPQAAAVTQVSSTKGSCQVAQAYRCSVGTLDPGGTATVTVRFSVSPSVPTQTLRYSAVATSAEGASTTAAGAVDIKKRNELSLTATGTSVMAGGSGRITFEVANNGPSDADGTTVTGTLPAVLTVTGVSFPAGSCTVGQAYTCEVRTLHPGDSATVSVQFSVSPTATATTLNPAAHTTTAEGAAADAQAAVTVSQPPPPGGSYGGKVDSGETTATASPGGQVTVNGSGFRPGSDVEVWLHSTPIFLGVTRADDNGAFTATYRIPAAAEVGSHHIVLEGIAVNGAETSVTLDLDVLATLPTTGGGSLLRIGLFATLAGIMTLVARWRRTAA